MWNYTGIPLAYFITFRCYGTWLHGDERGSTDRFQNIYATPHIEKDARWLQFNIKSLKHKIVKLNSEQRNAVEQSIRETCSFNNWQILAINVRTNHVHIVVSIGKIAPQISLIKFKANTTRYLREQGLWNHNHSPWSDSGSTRYLWNERSIDQANDYVINGQSRVIPEFE